MIRLLNTFNSVVVKYSTLILDGDDELAGVVISTRNKVPL